MKRKHRRLLFVSSGLAVLAVAVGLVAYALNDTLLFFYGPSDLADRPIAPDRQFRLGGLVEEGSVVRGADGAIEFRVTDLQAAVPVVYVGILPDLFREGQGVVAMGTLGADGVFRAVEILAKHDETYMPPEVAAKLRESGQWRGGDGAAGVGATTP